LFKKGNIILPLLAYYHYYNYCYHCYYHHYITTATTVEVLLSLLQSLVVEKHIVVIIKTISYNNKLNYGIQLLLRPPKQNGSYLPLNKNVLYGKITSNTLQSL